MNKGFLAILFILMFLPFIIETSYAQETARVDEKSALTRESKAEVISLLTSGKRKNPFLSLAEEQTSSSTDLVTPINYLSLSAILYSPGESKAIINGCILKERDYIDNKEIIEIKQEAVILKDRQGKYIVGLRKKGS